MSWGGSGGFFGPSSNARPGAGSAIMADPGRATPTTISSPAKLDDLRAFARDAYAKGRLADAIEAQSAVLIMARAAGSHTADDFLFAGLIHHALRHIADAVGVLRDGIGLYPDNASLHENLAVLLLAALDVAGSIAACETALALGSDSPNVRDCLCEAYQCAGRADLAVEAGRLALEAKDRRFGNLASLVAMPDGLPPPFDPNRPEHSCELRLKQ